MADRHHTPIAALAAADACTRLDRAVAALAALGWLADCADDGMPASRLVPLIDIITAELHTASIAAEAELAG